MPGSLAHDALAPSLTGGFASPLTSTTTSSIVEVGKPFVGRARLKTGTVGSTGNSATLSVEVQASDSSTFASGVVSVGRFAALSGTDASQSNIERFLTVDVQKRYLRAVATVAGTAPSYGTLVIDLNPPRYKRTATDSA